MCFNRKDDTLERQQVRQSGRTPIISLHRYTSVPLYIEMYEERNIRAEIETGRGRDKLLKEREAQRHAQRQVFVRTEKEKKTGTELDKQTERHRDTE